MQAAKKKGYLTVLYLYNSEDGAARIKKFEDTLFKNEKVALSLKMFRQLKLDVAKDNVAKGLYAKQLPCFIAFNAKGQRVAETTLKGYKSSTSRLIKVLTKASKGHGDMPLATFTKKYRTFLNELDKLEKRKEAFAGKLSRAGNKKSKLRKLEKDRVAIAASEKKLLESEKKLLQAAKAYAPKTGAVVIVKN